MTKYAREPFEVVLGSAAKRALADKLPPDVAIGAYDFISGPLRENPYRVGKELNTPLDGVHSARVMRNWRLLYEIHEDMEPREIHIIDIRHRSDAYRPR